MYEEYTRHDLNIFNLVIKISIIVIVLLVIGLTLKNTMFKNEPVVEVNTFKEHLIAMEDVAKNYYLTAELPTKLQETKELSLSDMIDENLIDKDVYEVNNCSLTESFAKITYIGNNDYNLKVKLNCNSKDEYIIDTIKIDNKEL